MWAEWSTAQIALVISGLSFLLALSSLIWNVWSKFIFPKPKVNVSMSVMVTIPKRTESSSRTVAIRATNFGPIDVTLKLALGREKRTLFHKHPDFGILQPYNNYPIDIETSGPFSGGLPKILKVGEEFSVYFPIIKDWFEKEKLEKFGFQDTFGRYHWCPASNVKSTRQSVLNGESKS